MFLHRLSIIFLLSALFAISVRAAEYNDLSDDCKGQYIFMTGSGTPYTFIRLDKNEQWLCARLADGKQECLAPQTVSILPLYADSDDFDIIAFTAGYAVPNRTAPQNEFLLKIHREILKYRSSPRGDKLRQCLNSIEMLCGSVQKELSHLSNGKKSAADNIVALLDNSATERLIDSMLDDSDFQLAFACYLRLRFRIASLIGTRLPSKYSKDVQTILSDIGTEVREAFANNRSSCQARVSQYQAAVPFAHGIWSRSNPVSDGELLQLFLDSFESFQKTLDYSEHTEFPQWGSAMLGVFMLLPNDALISKQAVLFDECLKKYNAKFQQTP